MEEIILQTKLHMPPLQPSLVPRPHLIEQLDAGQHRRLTLLSAPAGFGKTTLVSDWLATRSTPVVWLSLDEEDSDPIRFLRYFIAGIQTIHAGFGEQIVPTFAQTPPPPLKMAIAALINEISEIPGHIVFVLDDYHLVRSDAIQEILAYLLKRQPHQLHLVITTREDPPVPLHRWRAKGELTEIRERDLRFTTAEATTLLNDILGLNLTSAQIEKLDRKTEGWVSGLRLAALSLRGHTDVNRFVDSFAGSNRFILDYLIEEVFQQQPPDVRKFLLQTAVLEQLTAPLCDAIMLNEGDSQAMLERLEKGNLFILRLDDSRRWFRYHDLFADLLRQRLRVEKIETAALHIRAAHWYEENGFRSRAANHYLKAAAWEEAATLIQSENEVLQKRGENIRFLRWMEVLPEPVIQANPILCLDYAWALALNGEPDRADSFLQFAEEAFRHNPERYGSVLSAQIHLARIRHDLPRTISLSRRALSLIPTAAYDPRSALLLNMGIAQWQLGQIEDAREALTAAREAAEQAQNYHVGLLATGFSGMVLAAQGHLHKAESLIQSALAWGSDWPASGLSHLVLGALLYEWNRLDEAAIHLQAAIDLAQRSGNSELACSAHRQWALLKLAEGDVTAASSALMRAESAAGSGAPAHTQDRNIAVAVNVALAQHDLEKAQDQIEKMQTAASASPFYSQLFLPPARLSLVKDDKTAAAAHLAAEFAKADQAGNRYGQIEIRLLQALAAADANDALDFLIDALTMAHAANFTRIFLDIGKALIPLLHMAVSKQIFPDYAGKLLALFAGDLPTMPTPPVGDRQEPVLVEAISEREIEVLQLLADGNTNAEIARIMFISVNTVKSHLKSIYGKLNVHNRREAVARARLLHLIPSTK